MPLRRKLLGDEVGFRDLAEVRPAVHDNLLTLRSYAGDFTDLGLVFQVPCVKRCRLWARCSRCFVCFRRCVSMTVAVWRLLRHILRRGPKQRSFLGLRVMLAVSLWDAGAGDTVSLFCTLQIEQENEFGDGFHLVDLKDDGMPASCELLSQQMQERMRSSRRRCARCAHRPFTIRRCQHTSDERKRGGVHLPL